MRDTKHTYGGTSVSRPSLPTFVVEIRILACASTQYTLKRRHVASLCPVSIYAVISRTGVFVLLVRAWNPRSAELATPRHHTPNRHNQRTAEQNILHRLDLNNI